MWAAIKGDLLDFVDTIKNDTTKTLSKVIGDNNDDDNDLEVSIRQKALTDLRRSFNTYASPIEQQNIKEFEKYLKTFSLSSQAAEISSILDDEQDVARFYTELVPVQIRPEEFWARYFYRNLLLTRNGVVNLDDDDDDDEGWESTEKNNDTIENNSNNTNSNNTIDGRTIQDIHDENINLKKHMTTLTLHIAELERLLEAERAKSSSQLTSSSQLLPLPSQLPPVTSISTSQLQPVASTSQLQPTTSTSSTTVVDTETITVVDTETITVASVDIVIDRISPPIEKVSTSLSLAESENSESCVLIDMEDTAAQKIVLTPENKAKILASLDNDDDDDDDEWS